MLTARVSAALRLGYASGHVSRGKAQGRGRHVTAAGSGYTERVLRYPDGLERRIRYPEPDRKPLQDLVIADTDGSYRSFSETEQPDRWGPPDWDVTEIWNSQDHPQNSAVASIAAPNHHHQQQQQAAVLDELFAQVEGSSYQAAQQQFWQRITDSYKVHEHCPWLQRRPLHVLAVEQMTVAASALFTLTTRMQQSAAEDELSKVLGRRRRNGAPLVAVHHMAQGVVAFTSPEAAERFGERLDEDGHEGVALATLDSHALFRMTADNATVVVVVADDADVSPGELEASLRARGEAFSSDTVHDRPQC